MPSATMSFMAGPRGQFARGALQRMTCRLKITPNFSFANSDELRDAVSVCEQRNAAFVRTALEEKKRKSESKVRLLKVENTSAVALKTH